MTVINQRKSGALLSYIHIVVTTIISLIYTPYMLRVMGQSEYGLYSTASSFIAYLSVLSFGIGGSYIRFNAIARARADTEEEKRLNGMYLFIYSVLSLLVLVCGLFLEGLAGELVKNSFSIHELRKLRIIMAVLIANTILSFICNVFMMALQAYEEFFFIRIVLLLAAIIQPIVNVIALKSGGRAITITVISFLVSLLSYAAMFLYAYNKIKFRVTFHGFRKDVMKEIAFFSGYLFLNSVTDQITFSTDALVLGALKGTEVVAIYNIGAMFKGYFMQMSTSVSSVFAPEVNRIVAQHKDGTILDELFIRVGRIQFYIVGLVLIGYCSIGKAFICMWAGDDYINSFYVGLLLMIAIAIPLFQNVGIEIQKAKNMHKARSIVYFLIAIINVMLTIPFSRFWGEVGAALATTICMFVGTVIFMNYYYAKYIELNIRAFWKSITSIIPGLIVPIVIGVGIYKYVFLYSFLSIIIATFIICISYFISLWFLSFNEYEKDLLRSMAKKIIRKRN